MTTVIARKSFDHHGPRQIADRFEVSPIVARQLQQARLVSIVAEKHNEHPNMADGETKQSSASPAAPASRTSKSKKFDNPESKESVGSLL